MFVPVTRLACNYREALPLCLPSSFCHVRGRRHIAGCALQIITSSLCAAQIMSDASSGHGGCATNKGSTVQEMEIQATSLAAVQQVQLMTITFFFPNLWHYPFIFKFNSRKLSIVCITKSMDSKAPLTNYWAKEQSAVRRLFKKQQNKNVHTNILWESWGQLITNVWPTNCGNIGQVMVGTCAVDDHCRTIPIIPLTLPPAPSSQLAGQI